MEYCIDIPFKVILSKLDVCFQFNVTYQSSTAATTAAFHKVNSYLAYL